MQEIEPALEPVLEPVWPAVEPARIAAIGGRWRDAIGVGGKLPRRRLGTAHCRKERGSQHGADPERKQGAAGTLGVHGYSPWCTNTVSCDRPSWAVTIVTAKVLAQLKKF